MMRTMMAAWSLFTKRRFVPQVATQLIRVVRLPQYVVGGPPVWRGVHGSARSRVGEKQPWGKSSPQQQQQHHRLDELDKADALILRKSHETGFLSWFRNGLLATGIGVIAFVQSDVGREAGYAFFILGGVCVSFGAASYVGSLLTLRRLMLLSVPAVLLHAAVVGSISLFWLCAVSLYIGRLEVEIIHDDEEGEEEDDEEECRECRERREHRGYRGSHDDRHGNKGNDNKGQNK